MVAVKMGDENHLDGLELAVILAELVLCRLAAVDEYLRAADIQELGAAVTVEGGRRRPRTEDQYIEV